MVSMNKDEVSGKFNELLSITPFDSREKSELSESVDVLCGGENELVGSYTGPFLLEITIINDEMLGTSNELLLDQTITSRDKCVLAEYVGILCNSKGVWWWWCRSLFVRNYL